MGGAGLKSETLTLRVIEALNELGLEYMLVGSFSSNVYGIPRSTKDADFVVDFGSRSAVELVALIGPDFQLEPQMSFETITGTKRHRLRHAESAFMIELFLPSDDPHDRERFSRRQSLMFAGAATFVPTVEDVIVTKLRWSRQGKRDKDVDDVRDVISVSGGMVDWDYVNRWCELHGTRDLLDGVRRSAPQL
jgi:hypothetical protein